MPTLDELKRIAYQLAGDQVSYGPSAQQAVLHPAGGSGQPLFNAILEFGGRQGFTHAYSVVFHPGMGVAEHDHPEDVILFYPDAPKTPVIIADEEYWPKEGEMVLVRKWVRHEVPPNTDSEPRISIALKVTDE